MKPTNEDVAILKRYAETKDAEAFSALVGRYQGFVYGICLRVLANAADAEDVAQECFLRLIRNSDSVRYSLGGWLHHCATDMSTNEKRSQAARKRREEVSVEMNSKSDSDPTWHELSPHVDEAVDGLPDDLRIVIVEHFFQRRTQAEIAKELGVSAMTVSRRVESGIEELRKELKKAGVIASVAVLASLLAENAVTAAPATLTAALGKMAIAGVNSGAAAGWTGTGVAAGAMTTAAKIKIAAVVVAAMAVGGFVAHEAVNKRQDKPDAVANQQDEDGPADLAAAADGKAEAVQPADPEAVVPRYDHFLFMRRNKKESGARTVTLVMANVTPEGFKLCDLYTKRDLLIGWEPLCVRRGKVYAIHRGRNLVEVDVATGKAEELCSSIQSYACDSGRLYAKMHDSDGATRLRIYDFRIGAYRDLVSLDGQWSRPELAVSPDHKRLAFFGMAELVYSYRLNVVDLETGKIEQRGDLINYIPWYGGIAAREGRGSPLIWIDARTVLHLRSELPKSDSSGLHLSDAVNKLATIDVITGKMKDVARVPGRITGVAVRLIRNPDDGTPHLALRSGLLADRYRIDTAAGKLIEDDTIGGAYRLRAVDEVLRLFHGNDFLGEPLSRVSSVSPDGKRIVWEGNRPVDEIVHYHDSQGRSWNVACPGLVCWILWFTEDDLRVPSKQAKKGAGWIAFAEPPWGAPVDGVQCRLRPEKRVWRVGDVPKLKAEVLNQGKRDFDFLKSEAHFEVQYDGRWYVHGAGEILSGNKLFGPGKRYEGISIGLGNYWCGKEDVKKRLQLAPGKHIVRVALDDALVPKPAGEMIRVVSNPVEIEVIPAKVLGE
ncbi:MAG: sigma-70 family RNA polymerase sigma factor [Planctomycetes bacterium]|nr:sigma-70 family RNA polymerase sigma factor [Planctomycetota bacterium]